MKAAGFGDPITSRQIAEDHLQVAISLVDFKEEKIEFANQAKAMQHVSDCLKILEKYFQTKAQK